MNVLVDADALVAIAKVDDSNHQKASKLAQRIEKASLFISPFTIPEAVSVISHKVSQEAACLFLKEVRKKKITTLPLTEEIIEETDRIFINQKKKGTSWPDCLNMAIAGKYTIDFIFSFDKVYERNGYKTLISFLF